MAIINYSSQNYDPPMIQAMPSRSWCTGTLSLNDGTTQNLFFVDGIVIYRGLEASTGSITPAIPGAGQNIRIDLNCTASGITLMPQEDLGNGTFVNMLPVGTLCPTGFTSLLFGYNGFYFRPQVTRVAATSTVITFCVSILGYT